MPAAAKAVECFRQTGAHVPRTSKETPFAYAEKATLFEWLKMKPEQRECFDRFMAERRKETTRWFDIFPVETLRSRLHPGPQGVLIVDIGGSHGHDLINFRERYIEFPGRLVLQDLPETIDSIHNLRPGIEAMAHDFFTPQPIIGESYYIQFLRTCHLTWRSRLPCLLLRHCMP